jgi:putative membrane protein
VICPGMADGMSGVMGMMMVFWAIFLLVLLALAIAALLWLVRQLRGPAASPERSAARDALDRRYAAGDIAREEYLQARGDLER